MANEVQKRAGEKAAKDVGGSEEAAKQEQQTTAVKEGELSNAPLDGKIIRRKQNRDGSKFDLPSTEVGALHAVAEDVYEEFFAVNSRRPLYRLRFPRGTVVLKSEYDAFMSGGEDAAAAAGTGDVSQQVVGEQGRVGGTVERG